MGGKHHSVQHVRVSYVSLIACAQGVWCVVCGVWCVVCGVVCKYISCVRMAGPYRVVKLLRRPGRWLHRPRKRCAVPINEGAHEASIGEMVCYGAHAAYTSTRRAKQP